MSSIKSGKRNRCRPLKALILTHFGEEIKIWFENFLDKRPAPVNQTAMLDIFYFSY
jgi:hypothetical protein